MDFARYDAGTTYPRARGGDPLTDIEQDRNIALSPRTRG